VGLRLDRAVLGDLIGVLDHDHVGTALGGLGPRGNGLFSTPTATADTITPITTRIEIVQVTKTVSKPGQRTGTTDRDNTLAPAVVVAVITSGGCRCRR
jgi:hypothetical protein